MSIIAYYFVNGKKVLTSAEKACRNGWGPYGFKCCGYAIIDGKKVNCNADLMLIKQMDGDSYFKETCRIGDETHIHNCFQNKTNSGFSKEYKYRDCIQPVNNLNNLGYLLNDVNARNGNVHGAGNLHQPANNNNNDNRDRDVEERNRDIPPRTVLDHIYCLRDHHYGGNRDDFLYSENYEAYRRGETLLRGAKIAEGRRFFEEDGYIAKALADRGVTLSPYSKRNIFLQDPFIGDNPVVMLLLIDERISNDDVKKIRDRVFFPDYNKDFLLKVDKDGNRKLNGPYFAVYANWESYMIPLRDGSLKQVAVGSIVSKKQAQLFGNSDLADLKDILERWVDD